MADQVKDAEILPGGQEMTLVSDDVLSLQSGLSPAKLRKIMRDRLRFLHTVAMSALERTTPNDWTNQDGSPYLQASGAEKLILLFGISIKGMQLEKEPDGEGFMSYKWTGVLAAKGIGGTIETVGGRSSADEFFTGTMCDCGHKRDAHWDKSGPCNAKIGNEKCDCHVFNLRPKRIDLLDVEKAAYSNFIATGVSRLLGLRGLTWEQVEEWTGGRITRKTAKGQIDYGKKPQREAEGAAPKGGAANGGKKPDPKADSPKPEPVIGRKEGIVASVEIRPRKDKTPVAWIWVEGDGEPFSDFDTAHHDDWKATKGRKVSISFKENAAAGGKTYRNVTEFFTIDDIDAGPSEEQVNPEITDEDVPF